MEHYLSPKGTLPPDPQPGDIGLVFDHKPSAIHELIQARERVTCGHTAWANLTHAICVVNSSGDIVEALAEGIVLNNISKYKDMDFWLVRPPADATDVQISLCVARWLAQVHDGYDVLAFVGETFRAFGLPVSIHTQKEFICSGLACYGWLAFIVDYPMPFEVMTPADIGMLVKLPIDATPIELNLFARFLDRLALTGKLAGRIF